MTQMTPSAKATSVGAWLAALWKFSRPHTIIGTSLSVFGIAVITMTAFDGLDWTTVMRLMLGAWIPCLCGNVYIVGLNQLTDVEIDRINKPQLPLASGAYTITEGIGIVSTAGILALGLALWQGPYLFAMVLTSLLIGTAYSLPPLRLKRFAFWAALCIFGVRGVIVNLGLSWHFQDRWLGQVGAIAPEIWTLTVFIVVYTFAIAIFKDIPDLEGDRHFQIRTLTVRVGGRFVFNLARLVISACYVGMILMAWVLPSVSAPLITISHGCLLALFWWRSLTVNLEEQPPIRQFYQLIWQLFYWEYILFPLACLLG